MTRVQISVLRASWALGPVAYGFTIHSWIEKNLHRVNYGHIYVAMDELERLKLITTHHGDPTPERGGRAKRFVTLTDLGVKTLAALATEAKWGTAYDTAAALSDDSLSQSEERTNKKGL